MGKTVYSLVLSDEIVAAVDALAAREGYSRSALVDHILAEYASLISPKTHARQAVSALEQLVAGLGFRGSLSQGGTLTLRTALHYKYNPSLAYSVELKESEGSLGRLNVTLRSQNAVLLTCFGLFFDVWRQLEARHLPQPPPAGCLRKITGTRYLRTLRRPKTTLSAEQEGEAAAGYISLMDACMKTYFDNLHDAAAALRQTEQQYLRGLDLASLTAQL